MEHGFLPRRLSAAFWGLCLVLAALVAFRLQREAAAYLGIADASENVVSSETSAEVVSIDALPGQKVSKGDTLLLLRRSDLEVRINDISRQLQGAVGSASRTDMDVNRMAAELRSGLEARRTEMLAEIRRLEEERSRNRELVSSLSVPAPGSASDSSTDPILLRIQGLRRQIRTEELGATSQLDVLRGGGGDQKRVARDLQGALRRELSVLLVEQEKLLVRAPIDGVVGSVDVRAGEKVAPFAPMLTISPRNPTLVRAYINENAWGQARVGDSVRVVSSGARSQACGGRIVGVGSRIVEFPLRLRRMPQVAVWGREVVVRLPDPNPYLLGEMVSVRRTSGASSR